MTDTLLRHVKLPQNNDDEMLLSIKAMLKSWQQSDLEDVRMRGIRPCLKK